MNNDVKSNKYLNLYSSNSKEMKFNKYVSIKDFNYNKIPLIQPNKKEQGKFSFSLEQNNYYSNNKCSLIPINKIILQKKNDPHYQLEQKYNHIPSDQTDNNFSKSYISSIKQIYSNSNKNFNIANNDFFKNNIDSLKYINYGNILTKNDSNLTNKQCFSTREYKNSNDSSDNKYDKVSKQKNFKSLNDYLIINSLKNIDLDTKTNINKRRSKLNSRSNKIILPKMELNHGKSIQMINKSNLILKETLTEKNNKIQTILNNKITIPKIFQNKRKAIVKNLKCLKALKNGLK